MVYEKKSLGGVPVSFQRGVLIMWCRRTSHVLPNMAALCCSSLTWDMLQVPTTHTAVAIQTAVGGGGASAQQVWVFSCTYTASSQI